METMLTAGIYLICLVTSALILYWNKASSYDSVADIWMNQTLSALCASNAANFLFVIIYQGENLSRVTVGFAYVFKTAYFLLIAGLVICWFMYADMFLHNGQGLSAGNRVFLIVVFGVACIIPLVNIFYHWMFSLDEDGGYRQNYMFYVDMILLFLIGAYKAVQVLIAMGKDYNRGRREQYIIIAVFPILFIAPAITVLFAKGLPVSCVAITFDMLCLFIVDTRHQVSLDTLTQVNNRANLMRYLEMKLENHFEYLYLMLLDLDRFKEINDTFGHLEGDKALRRLSGVLKRSCTGIQPRPYIARYGGDEFVIIVEGARHSADQISAQIEEELKKINQENDQYAINVSIGIEKWQNQMTVQELIKAADEEMYKVKMARKQRRGAELKS